MFLPVETMKVQNNKCWGCRLDIQWLCSHDQFLYGCSSWPEKDLTSWLPYPHAFWRKLYIWSAFGWLVSSKTLVLPSFSTVKRQIALKVCTECRCAWFIFHKAWSKCENIWIQGCIYKIILHCYYNTSGERSSI